MPLSDDKDVSKNEWLAAWEKNYKTQKNTLQTITKKLIEFHVSVHGDTAEAVRNVEVTVTGPDMRQPWHGTLVSTYKLRSENGVWKIYSEK